MANPNLGLKARARLGSTLRGKYTLEAVLGVGGMAVVYRARHRNRAEFAVKMLLPEYSDDVEVRTRFLREGYAANSVKHPGVVAIVDDDIAEDGSAFLVMELLDGQSGEDLLAVSRRIPLDAAVALACETLDVLAAAHTAGIVHRDIKPANVFVTRQGRVKVLDFGIARVRDAAAPGAHATQSGLSFGTPAFMSPEQALGRSGDVDERSDVWSTGAMLFTMLTGKLVHEGAGGQEILVKVATTQPRPIGSVLPDLPPAIARVIDRALAFHRDARWASAREMRAALLAAYQESFGHPPSRATLATLCSRAPNREVPSDAATGVIETTVKPVASDRLQPPAKRSRVAAIALGAASMLLALGLLTSRVFHSGSAETSRSAAPPSVSPPPSAVVLPTATPLEVPAVPVTSLPTARTPAPAVTVSAVKPHPTVAADPCKPNYTMDAEGNKHFKPECFQ